MCIKSVRFGSVGIGTEQLYGVASPHYGMRAFNPGVKLDVPYISGKYGIVKNMIRCGTVRQSASRHLRDNITLGLE